MPYYVTLDVCSVSLQNATTYLAGVGACSLNLVVLNIWIRHLVNLPQMHFKAARVVMDAAADAALVLGTVKPLRSIGCPNSSTTLTVYYVGLPSLWIFLGLDHRLCGGRIRHHIVVFFLFVVT